ncbi:hypothetical protein RclHR1_08950006 [Rhizophagus clarus]|uniref:F-box domain-containing protein n=1 Tax=Rhizophagus clarus TaxID=94130 RepID=A0A2Z6S2B2_9GLOM|nr:hypothetical protein RclHR1_08950006 [Rhizophagus clarus]GET03465.1 hypothetical protein GLOIN_2v637630 [Rhizophagus clarus]
MSIFSLPSECFCDIFSFLENIYLYNCLFVNRQWCMLAIPVLWKDPFKIYSHFKPKLINTLLSCLNEVETSSLIPFAINLPKNQNPLFEYGKFIEIIDQEYIEKNVICWLKLSNENVSYDNIFEDKRVQCLINVIYHVVIRQGLNLQEFDICIDNKIDMLFVKDLVQHEGITNLRTLHLGLKVNKIKRKNDNVSHTKTFLTQLPILCQKIVNLNLYIHKLNIHFVSLISYLIKSQPLERIYIYNRSSKVNVNEIIYAFMLRSKTLKMLSFQFMNLEKIDLSFILKLECLEMLEFSNCVDFELYQHCDVFNNNFQLKELRLLHNNLYRGFNDVNIRLDVIKTMINSLCGRSLCKLTLNIVTLGIIKVIKESCPNISYLNILIIPELFQDSIILNICYLSSLKILVIKKTTNCDIDNTIAKILGDKLTNVEHLYLGLSIDLLSFEYFTINCKADLKKLGFVTDEYNSDVDKSFLKDYLICLSNYNKVHKSLKILDINGAWTLYSGKIDWRSEELEIVTSLENQGVQLISEWCV